MSSHCAETPPAPRPTPPLYQSVWCMIIKNAPLHQLQIPAPWQPTHPYPLTAVKGFLKEALVQEMYFQRKYWCSGRLVDKVHVDGAKRKFRLEDEGTGCQSNKRWSVWGIKSYYEECGTRSRTRVVLWWRLWLCDHNREVTPICYV